MSRLLDQDQNTSGVSQELGYCSICQEQFPQAVLTWIGGRFSCETCHPLPSEESVAETLAERNTEEAMARATQRKTVDNIDWAVRYTFALSRYVIYGGGCYLAMDNKAIADVLHGLVMADLATWFCTFWYDIRINRWPVIIEFVGFVALTNIMLHTEALQVPSDPASIGLAFLAFVAFFTIKGSMALFSRLHDHD